MLKRTGLLTILTIALITAGCATTQKKDISEVKPDRDFTKEAIELEAGESGAYRRIQDAFAAGKNDLALTQCKAFWKKYPKSPAVPRVFNIEGLIYLEMKRYLQAAHFFKKAAAITSDEVFKSYVLYNYASTLYEAQKFDSAKRVLSRVKPADLGYETRIKFHYLKSLVLKKEEKYPDAVAELLNASYLLLPLKPDQGGDTNVGPHPKTHLYRKQVVSTLADIQNMDVVEDLEHSFDDSPFADEILFRLGSIAMKERNLGVAEDAFRKIVTGLPDSARYLEAVEFLKTIKNQSVVNERAIGVLLPMTGRFARYGAKALNGIQSAFKIYHPEAPDRKIHLIIGDSGEDPQIAIQALEDLFFKHHVVAVIGPLLSKGIKEVTERAQQLGVPLISLAQQKGTAGSYIFHSSVTAQIQAYEIARYAIENKGFKRFAVVYPNDKFGQEYTHMFWDAVESLGGEIVGVESYPTKETDFRVPIDRLTGRYYTDAREHELKELELLREENDITRRNHKTEKYFRLDPIVDFEAVFIPDEAKTVAQILPTFAYKDVEGIQYLGISTWNSQQLIKRASKYANQSLFVDTFFAQSQAPQVKKFVTDFTHVYGYTPTAIEAQAFDSASLLDQSMLLSVVGTGSDRNNRRIIRDRLAQITDYPGVTGKITYINGSFARKLRVLGVQGYEIVELEH